MPLPKPTADANGQYNLVVKTAEGAKPNARAKALVPLVKLERRYAVGPLMQGGLANLTDVQRAGIAKALKDG